MDFEKLRREEEEAIALMTGKSEENEEENPEVEEEEVEIDEAPSTDDDNFVEEEKKPEKSEEAVYKKRFTNYKASTDIKLFENRKTIASQKSIIADLNEEVDKLKEENRKLRAQLEGSVDKFKDVFTTEDEELIGPEAVQIIKKAMSANTGSSKELDQLKAELAQIKKEKNLALKKEYEDLQAQSFNDLKMKLSTVVEDWEQIDKEPKFGEFIQEVDPVSGTLRSKLFSNAINAGDVYNVARFYKEYKALKPKSKEEVLSAKVTPVSGGDSGPRKGSPDTTVYRVEDYMKFMDDVAKGKWRNKMKEAKIKERQYDLAFQQGRLR